MLTLGKTFRIFVSSTFSDLIEERNALQQKVFPRLRELCRQHGCRFQAIDLRWGVREEAGLDQQTMKICLGEIERCQKITPQPNFIVLLGDRYGWRPLPPEIPAEEFKGVIDAVTGQEDKALLEGWYRRDNNAVPPVYYLRPRKVELKDDAGDEERHQATKEESRLWKDLEIRLRRILCDAVTKLDLGPEQKAKYFSSATEQEIEAGAMRVSDAGKHVHCFFRTIEGLPRDKSAGDYIDLGETGSADADAQTRLRNLKTRLEDRLKANVHKYKAAWQGGVVSALHLDGLCEDVWLALSGVILSQMKQMAEMDPFEKEKADHEAFGRERARFFFRPGDLPAAHCGLSDGRRQASPGLIRRFRFRKIRLDGPGTGTGATDPSERVDCSPVLRCDPLLKRHPRPSRESVPPDHTCLRRRRGLHPQ